MRSDLYEDYNEIDEKGTRITGRYYRPTHGLSHTLRVSIFGQFIALNLLKFNTFPLITELITQEFLIKIGIILLFYVTGRESEAGFNIKNLYCCENAKKSDNNPRLRYADKSIEYLKEYILKMNNDIYDNKLFIDDEINTYADAIYDNHSIMDEIISSENPNFSINNLSKLLKYIFYSAHIIDLIRIGKNIIITENIEKIKESKSNYNLYCIYSPIKFNVDIQNEFINKNKLFVLNIQKVFYFTGQKSSNILIYIKYDISFDNIIEPYYNSKINIIKYKCQTDYKYCIEKILEASNYYINNLIETLSLETLLFFDKHKNLINNLGGDLEDGIEDGLERDLEGGLEASYNPEYANTNTNTNTNTKLAFNENSTFKFIKPLPVPKYANTNAKLALSVSVPVPVSEINYYNEDDDLYDIEDIYNIENNKIKPYYLYLSKLDINIKESENNKYKFRKTFLSMDQIKKSEKSEKEENSEEKKNDLYFVLETIMKYDCLNPNNQCFNPESK